MNRTPMSQSYHNSQAGQEQQQQQSSSQDLVNSQSSSGNSAAPGGAAAATATSAPVASSRQTSGSNAQQLAAAAAANNNNNAQQQQTMNMMIGSSGEQMSQMTSLLLEFAFSAFVNKPHDIVEYAAQYFSQLKNQQTSRSMTTNATSDGLMMSGASGDNTTAAVAGGGGGQQKRASSDSQRTNFSQNSFTTTNDAHQQATNLNSAAAHQINNTSEDDDFDTYDNSSTTAHQQRSVNFQPELHAAGGGRVLPKTSYSRRKSVFAEAYDPAADEGDDENNRVVHGKTDEQRQRLAKAIKSIFLFRSVDPQDVTQILDAMFEVRVKPGDVVIRQGDDGDNFYVVERGKFQIYYTQDDGTKQVRGEYEDNGFFGELALMYNQPRAATVVALTSGSLWAMDRKTFRRIVLKSAFKKRKEYEALFEKVSVLQCLNGYERMNLCDALESKRFLNGQMIIVQGDQANGMYFIESGNVKIVKQMEDGRVIDVAILGKGDYFGELALINHKPRAASVYAMGDDVKLAFLDVKAFERLLGSCIERMEKNCAMYLSELAHQEGIQNV